MHLDDESDAAILARAASFVACPAVADVTHQQIRDITRSEGVDFATALLFDRVRRSATTAAFVELIDQLASAPPTQYLPAAANAPLIGVVPAAFYKEKPRSGADGRVVRQAAARLGFDCELVPISSSGTLAENSSTLLDWLKARSRREIVLVSLCKGGADVKYALSVANAAECFANVSAWVNICGTLGGSPVAQWLLATKLRSFGTWLFLKSGGRDLQFLREAVPSPTGSLSGECRLLPTIQLINIVGFPLRRHLSNGFMRRCHKIMSSQGPNDGGVMLLDVCCLPGVLYPVWGADHYLRPDDRALKIITAVLSWLTNRSDSARNPSALFQASGTPSIGPTARTLSA